MIIGSYNVTDHDNTLRRKVSLERIIIYTYFLPIFQYKFLNQRVLENNWYYIFNIPSNFLIIMK